MILEKIPVGKNPPHDLNVVIEIPMNSDPIKYEFDKETGAIVVDRICNTPMFYPCNYGFVPNTIAGDGDPLDVMVICRYPISIGAVINVKPIGVLMMEDDGGKDEKIIAIPSHGLYKYYEKVNDINDLPESFILEIKHFFEHYKDLDPGKWVKISSMLGANAAMNIINQYIL